MPPLIALAVLGAGAYVGYRVVRGLADELEKTAVRVRERSQAVEPKDLGTLEYDPRTGEYRPRR